MIITFAFLFVAVIVAIMCFISYNMGYGACQKDIDKLKDLCNDLAAQLNEERKLNG